MDMVKDKVAIVTGGSRGIGRAIAQKLYNEGARVIIGDIMDANLDGGESVENSGPSSLAYMRLDVSDGNNINEIIQQVVKGYGSLDILVNNAGIMFERLMEDTSEEDWDRMMDINVKGVFLCSKYAVGPMRESGGGAIVNIGSIEGIVNNPEHTAYAASKGAVHALTRAIAVDEGTRSKVRCNSVCPGWINTELNEAYFDQLKHPEEGKKAIEKLHPVGRMGTPEDIANMVCWLAGDEAGFVTGQKFVVDGGRTARPTLADFDSMEKSNVF